jgi:hypothetical protein
MVVGPVDGWKDGIKYSSKYCLAKSENIVYNSKQFLFDCELILN